MGDTTIRRLLAPLIFFISMLLSAQALAFDSGGFSYTVIGATLNVEVTGRASGNTDTDIVIPDTVQDSGTTYSVTTIGLQAFQNNNLTSVIIPDGVTIIGNGAFANNDLTSVIIPDSVTTIEDYAFANNALTSVTIGNSVTTIGDAAFQFNALTSVTIGNNVETIGTAAFYDNTLTSVTIPDSVTSIGDSAFTLNVLTSATFLGNFGTFNLNMFQDNTNLTAITYSQGATGWPQTFTPGTGPTGSVTATAPPATPAAPTATAGDSQASVTWTKPADGGSTITGYTVTSAPDGRTCTTSNADTLTCDVTGLTNGTAYTFSVTATNGVGNSAASAASSSVTPAAPPAPPVPTVATPVPTSPLWLLGIMAGLLSLVGIGKVRKA